MGDIDRLPVDEHLRVHLTAIAPCRRAIRNGGKIGNIRHRRII